MVIRISSVRDLRLYRGSPGRLFWAADTVVAMLPTMITSTIIAPTNTFTHGRECLALLLVGVVVLPVPTVVVRETSSSR